MLSSLTSICQWKPKATLPSAGWFSCVLVFILWLINWENNGRPLYCGLEYFSADQSIVHFCHSSSIKAFEDIYLELVKLASLSCRCAGSSQVPWTCGTPGLAILATEQWDFHDTWLMGPISCVNSGRLHGSGGSQEWQRQGICSPAAMRGYI